MEIPTELVVIAATGAGGLLVNSAIQLKGISTKLIAHIEDESKTDVETHKRLSAVSRRLRQVEQKLPNGEVELMFKMTKELYRSCKNGDMGEIGKEIDRVEKLVIRERKEAEYDDYI